MPRAVELFPFILHNPQSCSFATSPTRLMLKLEDIKKNASVVGVEPGQIVRIVTTEPVGDNALTVYYKTAEGRLLERILFRTNEVNLSLAEAGRPWPFDANGEDFKLAAEAWRINLAHLFDPMMAVHTSNVEPLPHQITAVHESMLPRQPLRYVLADDPGAGKTIMAERALGHEVINVSAQKCGWDVTSINLDLNKLLGRSTAPCA